MINIEHIDITGWEAAIRGMRNPMNSWDKSDSAFQHGDQYWGIVNDHPEDFQELVIDEITKGHLYDMTYLGPNDLSLMKKLARGGGPHAKFRRMINVTMDITAPLYWWKEFDTYKVGTVTNSCSTMHKIHAKEFDISDFSCEHLMGMDFDTDERFISEDAEMDAKAAIYPYGNDEHMPAAAMDILCYEIIPCLNKAREEFLKSNDKRYWWQMIQLLPSSYNQRRTVQLNYETLSQIYKYRRAHKLDEWREFCEMIENLPYSELITVNAEGDADDEVK